MGEAYTAGAFSGRFRERNEIRFSLLSSDIRSQLPDSCMGQEDVVEHFLLETHLTGKAG